MTTTRKLNRETVAEASAWFIEFRTAEPAPADRDRFNDWLRASPQHIQAYFEVAAAWAELPGREAESRIDIDALIAAARATPENIVPLDVSRGGAGAPRRAVRRLRPGLAIAASFLLATIGAMAWIVLRGGDTYVTGIGEQRTIRLADGSTIELNALSTVEVRLTQHERHVELLAGQALFRVAKEKQRPFVVETDVSRIRAVGTQFDVYRKRDGTIVTVLEGRVAVLSPQGRDPRRAPQAPPVSAPEAQPHLAVPGSASPRVHADEFLLAAGERVTLQSTSIEREQHADVAAATAWTQKRLVFEATPLREVAEEFNRYNTKRLVVADPGLEQVGISGLYSSTDPSALIAFLKAQPMIQVSESEDEIRIARRQPG